MFKWYFENVIMRPTDGMVRYNRAIAWITFATLAPIYAVAIGIGVTLLVVL